MASLNLDKLSKNFNIGYNEIYILLSFNLQVENLINIFHKQIQDLFQMFNKENLSMKNSPILHRLLGFCTYISNVLLNQMKEIQKPSINEIEAFQSYYENSKDEIILDYRNNLTLFN